MDWKNEIKEKPKLFWAALKKFDRDNCFFLSSGITFNLLIGLIPLSLLVLAIGGSYLYSEREVLNHIRQYLGNVAPSLDPKIMRSILRIIQDRKVVGVLGIGGLLWTSICIFSSLRTALNVIFRVEKEQGILRGTIIDLFMIVLVGILHITSMALTSVITYLQRHLFPSPFQYKYILGFFLKVLLPYVFTFWMFFLIYKIIPNRRIHFKIALQAALFTSLLWEITKQLFHWYVSHLGNFSVVYGSLGALIIFVLWVYYSSAILLLGGEVGFFLENRREGLPGRERGEK